MLAGIGRPKKATVICERGAAIRHAILESRSGDIIVIAGKGHEAFQEVDGRKTPFSDEDSVRSALEEAA
jgi:UDP-N-acetylmuramoyl-L-alanyl-D-glutamate--2,6-diaminopimelate ligase